MDAANNSDDLRRMLYEEFQSEVVNKGNTEAYFDEADLVEIFDYSSDMDNYIVKMEVLFYAARHYPDSQALATRRAWLYSSFGEIEAAAQINSRVSNGGVLNALLELRASGPGEQAEFETRLDAIVEATTEFGDEELIQLVDYCAENNLLSWIEKNYELIKSKSPYPQTFIYEYANHCEESDNLERAMSLFEELTMLEPFTLDFWERLIGVQCILKKYKEVITSADYALAINPTSHDALYYKALSLQRLNRDKEEVVELLTKLVDEVPVSMIDVLALVNALIDCGRVDEALERIVTYHNVNPPTRPTIRVLLAFRPELAAPYMDILSKQLIIENSSLLSWAYDEFKMTDNVTIAANIIPYIKVNELLAYEMAKVIEIVFAAGQFERVTKLAKMAIDNAAKDPDDVMAFPGIIVPYVISLIRRRRFKKALEVATAALSSAINTYDNLCLGTPMNDQMALRGYTRFLFGLIGDLSTRSSDFDSDTYYPKL
ncbi:MAG: hypothetical protein J1E29_02565 [Duncaniella sp.]|nr:hypothetical protein [Duncaniella sp.]